MANTKFELEAFADGWQRLADIERENIASGLALVPEAARNRADTYDRAAKSLRLEAETGKPHCTCCLKPEGSHGFK